MAAASADVPDFVCIAEFCEIVGPNPLLTIPHDALTKSSFDLDEFTKRLLASDSQKQLGRSSNCQLPEDTQVVLTEPDMHACALAQYTCLYDIDARGFTRTFVFAYVTKDMSKILQHYDGLLKELKAISKFLHISNYIFIRSEAQQRLNDLEVTDDAFLTTLAKDNKEVFEGLVERRNQLTRDMGDLRTMAEEHINDDPQYQHLVRRYANRNQDEVRPSRTATFRRDAASPGPEARANRSMSCTRPADVLVSIRAARPIDLQQNRDYDKRLPELKTIAATFYADVEKTLEMMYSHYHRRGIVLAMEEADGALLQSTHFLLTIGRTVVLNFFMNPSTPADASVYADMPMSPPRSVMRSLSPDVFGSEGEDMSPNTTLDHQVARQMLTHADISAIGTSFEEDEARAPYASGNWFDRDMSESSYYDAQSRIDELSMYSAWEGQPSTTTSVSDARHRSASFRHSPEMLESVHEHEAGTPMAYHPETVLEEMHTDPPVTYDPEPSTPVSHETMPSRPLLGDATPVPALNHTVAAAPFYAWPLPQTSSPLRPRMHSAHAKPASISTIDLRDRLANRSSQSLDLGSLTGSAEKRSKYPFQSAADHVNFESTSKPGAGLYRLWNEFGRIQHVVYALLSGRTVVVTGTGVGPKEQERLQAKIRKLVTTLWLFVPGMFPFNHVIFWKASQTLCLADLARVKLVGMPERQYRQLPRSVAKQVCVFDVTRKTYCGPRYRGRFLRVMFNRDLQILTEKTLLAHVHHTFLAIAWNTFQFFHEYCMKETSLMNVSSPLAERSKATEVMQQIGVEDSDIDILFNLAEVVKLQQTVEFHRSAGLSSGNTPMAPALPIRISTQQHCEFKIKARRVTILSPRNHPTPMLA